MASRLMRSLQVTSLTLPQTVIAAGDSQTLDRILSNAGLDKLDLDSRTEAIKADSNKAGNKISEW